jgi:hypothetical protein
VRRDSSIRAAAAGIESGRDSGKSLNTENTKNTEGSVSSPASVSQNMFLLNCTILTSRLNGVLLSNNCLVILNVLRGSSVPSVFQLLPASGVRTICSPQTSNA